ncbi:unnamed protein product [Rhodiola kirilowii]
MKLMRVLESIRKRRRNGMTRESFVVSSKRETRSLLFNSRLKLFPVKLRSRWSGPFIVHKPHKDGHVELLNDEGAIFKANGQRLNHYCEQAQDEHNATYSLTDP